ncbi:MAG: hypothetical protein WCX81_06640 [Monoglobales bacterium]
MNDIEKAVEHLKRLKNDFPAKGHPILYSNHCERIDLAISALQAQAEREKGCEYCNDPDCPPLDWRYGLDHILPGYKHCPMCGRGLEESE